MRDDVTVRCETSEEPTGGPGWIPVAMLGYLLFFLVGPAVDGGGRGVWTATIAGSALFVALYFATFATHGWRQYTLIGLIAALGFVFVPYNSGALVFFIYAGLFVPFVAGAAASTAAITVLVGLVLLQAWMLGYPIGYWLPATLSPLVAGIVNINVVRRREAFAKLRLAHDEIERLAKIAERERIARDMHDVLGHTMSVIILKSELASKLVDRDPERARTEIRDVERISREALAEIRETIRGYRSDGLEAELSRAKETLEVAGVAFEYRTSVTGLRPAEETVLALVVREAVTNVVRHARASVCRLELEREGAACRLEIADDGRGAGEAEGNGLRGMRERVEAIGGTLMRQNGVGTRLVVTLPLGVVTEGVLQ